jgi:hypothetical protein
MKRFALAMLVVLATGCDDEQTTADAQRVAECRQLEAHIFQITPRPGGGGPETDPARIKELVAKVPIEDIMQCAVAEEHKALDCMKAANDVAALRACIAAAKKK